MMMTLALDPADEADLASATDLLASLRQQIDESRGEPTDKTGNLAVGTFGRLTDDEKAKRAAASQCPWDDTTAPEVYQKAWARIAAMKVGAPIMRVLLDRNDPSQAMWREDLAAAAGVNTKSLRGVTGPLAEACSKEGVRRGIPFAWSEGFYSVPHGAALRWNLARRSVGENVNGPVLDATDAAQQ